MSSVTRPHLDEFAHRQPFPLDAFQLAACESLEDGRSVLVAAPTGSGKTTVAEFAIVLARGREQARVFYTAPIKALSNQKFRELCAQYGDDEVGLLTGDVNIRSSAPIIVMTTEVLRNMIYEGSRDLNDLAYVILDEVHFLGDRFRGAVWEEIILHLPKHVRLVSLSATVSNAEEFGDWMHTVRGDTDVIVSEHRPVPLFQHVLTRAALHPLHIDQHGELAERGKLNPELIAMERGRGSGSRRDQRGRGHRSKRLSRSDIARALDEQGLLPGIVFVFSRNGCDQAVRQCVFEGIRLTSREERDEIRSIVRRELKSVDDADLRVLGYSEWLAGLERGVAAHHAGLIPAFKHVVEVLFQRRLVKLVFATETLALGINMPAKSVTIEQLEKFNGETRVPLTPGEFTQLTGRAGRRGIDTEGHAIIAWEHRQDLDQIARLASNRLYPLKSSFKPTYNMAVNLLDRLSMEEARDMLELSFAQFQADRDVVELAGEVKEQRASLAGYQAAIDRSHGSDRKRWEHRERKLARQITRKLRDISNRTGTIARTFDRVVETLTDLDYVTRESERLTPTRWGQLLRQIYGERDLLVAECLRHGAWENIDAADLAALCCTIIYEPRREDEYDDEPTLPRGPFRGYFERTLEHWDRLDQLEAQRRLPQKPLPHPGLANMMTGWARGETIARTLEVGSIGPGDFVRVTKQTVDLLDQIAEVVIPHTSETARAKQIDQLQETARDAKHAILRGIVETARSA